MKTTLFALMMFSTVSVFAQSGKTGDGDFGKIFTAKCVTCHAKDGKGSPAMAKMFKVDLKNLDLTDELNQKKTDADLTKSITNGNGKMPSFKGKLKDAEIASAVAFIRSLAAPKPAPADKKPENKPDSK